MNFLFSNIEFACGLTGGLDVVSASQINTYDSLLKYLPP